MSTACDSEIVSLVSGIESENNPERPLVVKTVFLAVGDVMVDRDDPKGIWDNVSEVLAAADIRTANLEACCTDRPGRAPSTEGRLAPALRNLAALEGVFDVVTGANNHIVDGGHDGMLDTLDELHRLGIATCGFGRNMEEARKPAIVERNGLKVATLGYASEFPRGYQARHALPGLVPMRAHTVYHVDLESHAPGFPPEIVTFPYPGDVQAMVEDVQRARAEADIVVAQFHWGSANEPSVIFEYQHAVATAAIDAGVDIVIGHHPHELRGIRFHRGKPIFYGLGLFAFDMHDLLSRGAPGFVEKLKAKFGEHGMWPREGWPLLPMHPDARLTMAAYVTLEGTEISEVGFLPCTMMPDGKVVPRDSSSAEGRQVLEYVERVSAEEKLTTTFKPSTSVKFAGLVPFQAQPRESSTDE